MLAISVIFTTLKTVMKTNPFRLTLNLPMLSFGIKVNDYHHHLGGFFPAVFSLFFKKIDRANNKLDTLPLANNAAVKRFEQVSTDLDQ